MIEPDHPRLSIARQCKLVDISRSTFYYEAKGETPLNLKLMRMLDEQFLKTPRIQQSIGRSPANFQRVRLWTDDYISLMEVLK